MIEYTERSITVGGRTWPARIIEDCAVPQGVGASLVFENGWCAAFAWIQPGGDPVFEPFDDQCVFWAHNKRLKGPKVEWQTEGEDSKDSAVIDHVNLPKTLDYFAHLDSRIVTMLMFKNGTMAQLVQEDS